MPTPPGTSPSLEHSAGGRFRRFWLAGIPILVLLGLLALGLGQDPQENPSPLLNKPAPGFTLYELHSNTPLSSKNLQGMPYVLNFWASWCLPCRKEAPVLAAAHQMYGKQLRIIGVAVQDTPTKARAFAREFGKLYFLAMDDSQGSLALNHGIFGVPETFFVTAGSIIHSKHVGPITHQEMNSHIQALLQSDLTPASIVSDPP